MNDITIFVKNKISEYDILKHLEIILNESIDSMNSRNEKSDFFLQYVLYSQGFKTMVSLSWQPTKNKLISEKEIALAVAQEFKTQTLFELSNPVNEFDYLLIDPNSTEKLVNIIELEDGIDIK